MKRLAAILLALAASAGAQVITDPPTGSSGGGGGDALTSNPLSQFASTSCAQFAGVITGETGTCGSVVLSNSPALVTPNLGTPSTIVLTNATGLPVSTGISGLGANVATFLGTPSSANLLAAITDETGTGAAVFGTAPSFTTSLRTPLALIGTASSVRGAIDLFGATHAFFSRFQVSESQASDATYTLPINDGGASEFLQTNGSGVLTWAAGGGGITIDSTTITGGATTQIPYNLAGVVSSEAAFTYNATTNTLNVGGATGLNTWYTNTNDFGLQATGDYFRIKFKYMVLMNQAGSVNVAAWDQAGKFRFGDGTFASGALEVTNVAAAISIFRAFDNTTEVFTVGDGGDMRMYGTITAAGTTGAQTINKPSGTVNFAAAAASLVVTNSLVTTSHRVIVTPTRTDTTCTIFSATVASGSFTITAGAGCTAETEVYFQVWKII